MNTAIGLAMAVVTMTDIWKSIRDIVHIALAFEFQVFPEVPFEAHDILPQMIVTETRMIRPEGD